MSWPGIVSKEVGKKQQHPFANSLCWKLYSNFIRDPGCICCLELTVKVFCLMLSSGSFANITALVAKILQNKQAA